MSIIHILDHQNSEIVGWITEVSHDSHQNSLENDEKYEFIAPVTEEDLDKIQGRTRLLIPADEGDYREFIVYEKIDLTGDLEVEVYSEASYYDLRKLKTIHPQVRDGQTVEAAGTFVLEGINGWEIGITEYSGIRKWTIENDLDGYDALKAIGSLFDCEVRFRVTISGDKVTGRYVDFVKRVGQDSGKEIVEGKDLLGIKRRLLAKRVVTALICLGPKRADGSQLKVTVTDEAAYQNWNWQGQHLVEVYEPQSTDTEMTEERLTQLGEAELKKRVTAAVEYEAEGASLDHILGYNHEVVRLGDSAKIKDEKFNPPMYLDSRVVFIERSIFDKSKKKYKLGEVIEYKKEDVFKIWKDLQAIYATKVIKSPNPPVGKTNIIWIQTGGKVDVAHTWNAATGKWEKITPTEASEVGSYSQPEIDNKDQSTFEAGTIYADQVAQNAEDNAKQHTETYAIDKTTYTQKIQDIENELTEKVSKLLYDNNLATLQQDIAAKAGLEYVDGQLVSKADKNNTFTKTEVENQLNSKVSTTEYTTDQDGVVTQLTNHESRINQTEEGLTSKVSQTSYNQKVSSLETQISQANTLIQQNNQQIQLKASQTELDTLKGRVSNTESSLSVQAGLIESKVSQVEFEGLWIGRNLFSISDLVKNKYPDEENPSLTSWKFHGDPNTFYTLSTDIPENSGRYDLFFDVYPFQSSSSSNGVAENQPRTVQTDETGLLEVTFRNQSATYPIGWENVVSEEHHVKLEKGNKATDWTAAPEDVQDKINTINGRMSSAETKITQNTTAINLKASQSSVDSIAGRVSNAEASLIVQSGKIESKVSQTEFQSLQIGSRNLLRDTGFKNGGNISGIVGSGTVTTVEILEESSSLSGKAMKFTRTDSLGNSGGRYWKTPFVPPEGRKYSWSFYAKGKGKWNVGHERGGQKSIDLTDSWTKYTHTFTTNSNNYNQFTFYRGEGVPGDHILFHSLKWEEGDKPTQWTEAPEDTQNQIDSIDGRMIDAETKITQNTNAITLKASQATVDTLSGRVSNAESQLTVQSSQISSKVSQTTFEAELNKKVNSDVLENVGISNLLHNSEWEENVYYWETGTGWSRETGNKYLGSNSMKQIQSGNTQDRWHALNGEKINCSEGEDFVGSVYAFTDNPSSFEGITAAMELDFYNASNQRIALPAVSFIPVANQWTRYAVTAKAPADTAYIRLRIHVTRNGRLWVARPLLQRGKTATAWNKHVDEQATQTNQRVTNAESSITQLSNEISSKVSQTSFNSLSGRVSSAESTITQQAGLIEQKVSKNGVMSAISQTSETIKIAASKIQFEGAIFGQNAKFAGSIVSTDGTNTLKIDGDSISINDRDIFDSESTLPSMYDGNLAYPMVSSYGKMYLQEITFPIPAGTYSPGNYIEKTLNISNYTRVAIPQVLGFFCHAVAKEWYAYENDSTRVYGGTDIMSTKIRISPHYQYTSGGSSVKVYIMIIGYR